MDTVARKPYPSDLTDEQWELIELVIPSFKPGGAVVHAASAKTMNVAPTPANPWFD